MFRVSKQITHLTLFRRRKNIIFTEEEGIKVNQSALFSLTMIPIRESKGNI